jgi:hypothetical protein
MLKGEDIDIEDNKIFFHLKKNSGSQTMDLKKRAR